MVIHLGAARAEGRPLLLGRRSRFLHEYAKATQHRPEHAPATHHSMSRQTCHDFARGHCSRNHCRFEHATREHRELQQRQQWEREAKAQRDARGEAFSAGRTHSMSPATPRNGHARR